MYPVAVPVVPSSIPSGRSGGSGLLADARPVVPDGADRPGQRMARDNSRAVAPASIGGGRNATLQVTPELARLLALDSATVDMNQAAGATPVFATATPAATAATTLATTRVTTSAGPPGVDHNIPSSSWRYLDMSVIELLEEVVQRAIGEGPEDDVRNPDVQPHHQRMGAMAFALKLTPGREHDARVLRNAGLAINAVLLEFRDLLDELRRRRPDLAPVIPRWRAELIRSAVLRAIALPLDADGEPQYTPTLYTPIVGLLNQPAQNYIPQLEWRLGELQRHTFIAQGRQFFAAISVPIVRESPRENRVLGAAGNELEGPDLRDLLDGRLVFRCSEDELATNLQMVPAGKLTDGFSTNPRWSGFGGGMTIEGFLYPNRASGTTIKKVEWQDGKGLTRPVFVANIENVHAYSTDWGRVWRPTGSICSPVFDDLRADGWRRFLADRWHLHKIAALAAMPDFGGR